MATHLAFGSSILLLWNQNLWTWTFLWTSSSHLMAFFSQRPMMIYFRTAGGKPDSEHWLVSRYCDQTSTSAVFVAMPISDPSRHSLQDLHPPPFNLFSAKAEAVARTSVTLSPHISPHLSPHSVSQPVSTDELRSTCLLRVSPYALLGSFRRHADTMVFLSCKVKSLPRSLGG